MVPPGARRLTHLNLVIQILRIAMISSIVGEKRPDNARLRHGRGEAGSNNKFAKSDQRDRILSIGGFLLLKFEAKVKGGVHHDKTFPIDSL